MFSNNITIISASLADYLTIQNMARFYVYDLSRSCGFIAYFRKLDTSKFCKSRLYLRSAGSLLNSSCLKLSEICYTSNEYDWALPKDGLYESNDFKNYFTATDRKAYLVKVNNELAGFVLLNKVGTSENAISK